MKRLISLLFALWYFGSAVAFWVFKYQPTTITIGCAFLICGIFFLQEVE